ncbi:MAG: TraB/GumN family protein [Turneriella sp.]|nr:TraB/GumN family protein [Turneriella sp.]
MLRRLALLVLLAPILLAATDSAPRYFFYKASHGDATFYLLGSMHMGRPDDPDYPEKIYAALRGCRALIFESEVRPEKMRQPNLGFAHLTGKKKKLSQLLTAKERRRFYELLRSIGLNAEDYEHYQPWFIEFLVGYQLAFRQGYVLDYGTEHRLLRYVEQKLPLNERPRIFTLEAFDEVMLIMSQLPLAEQMKRFRAFLRYSSEKHASSIKEMAEYWRNGDEQKVLEIFHYYVPQASQDAYARALLFERNRRMAERIRRIAEYPGQYFVVSGALHLIGEKSIPEYLRRAGFHVERL